MGNERDKTGFQIKQILMKDPRVFLCDPRIVRTNHAFLRYVMRLQKKTIVENPIALRSQILLGTYLQVLLNGAKIAARIPTETWASHV